MSIETADWSEVQQILHETYAIWSPGLNRSVYAFFAWNQIHHHWSRKNYRYIVYKKNDEVLSSCKFYSLELSARGHSFPVVGVGAVYTPERKQGFGYASAMLTELTKAAKEQGYAGLLLYSDIGHSFYRRLDFMPLPYWNFEIGVNLQELPEDKGFQGTVRPLELADIPWLLRYYRRWLRRQPYGTSRSAAYLHFKLSKEIFFHENSSWGWPRLELVTLRQSNLPAGYAIIESSGRSLRVLEAIGSEETLIALWDCILGIARERDSLYVRGWNAQAPPHLTASFSQRTWGLPMMLPLGPEMQRWTQFKPYQLLELDHL